MESKKEITRRHFITTSSRFFIGGFVGIPIIDKDMTSILQKNSKVTPVPTGFTDFDNLTGGLQGGELIVLGSSSRQGMGKTAFTINVALHAAVEKNIPVAIFSLGLAKKQLGICMLSCMTGINENNLQRGLLTQNDWPLLAYFAKKLSNAPINVDDTSAPSLSELASKARAFKRNNGLGLIIIDYLQLMHWKPRENNRKLEITKIARDLKALAEELDVPVMALLVLHRKLEQRRDKRPILSDMSWSGNIEPYADRVIFIYRDEYYDRREDNPNRGIVEVIFAKQRNGPVGTVKLAFTRSCGRFQNLP